MGVDDCNSFLGADRGRELETAIAFLQLMGVERLKIAHTVCS